jgi:hypothetical protein
VKVITKEVNIRPIWSLCYQIWLSKENACATIPVEKRFSFFQQMASVGSQEAQPDWSTSNAWGNSVDRQTSVDQTGENKSSNLHIFVKFSN